MKTAVFFLVAAVCVGGCAKGPKEKVEVAPTGPLAALQTEIFTPRCALQDGCHRGVSAAGGLDLTAGHAYESLVKAKATRRPERERVSPGNPETSYLVDRLSKGGDTPEMPIGGAPLSSEELDRIRSWIKDGAPK